jgi:hypothetical protein
MKKKIAFLGGVLALPFITFAQALTSIQSTGQFVINLINNVAVPLVFALAFIVFIWGVFSLFILSRGNEEKQAEARNLILYGLVGFFLMVVVWGLVNILVGTFSFNSNPVTYPTAPSQ